MSRLSISWIGSIVLALIVWPSGRMYADKSAAEILPQSTMIYIEITQPADLISVVLDHPLLKQLQQTDAYLQATLSPQYQQFWQVVGAVEKQAGVQWRPALEGTTHGGIVLAFEPFSQSVALLLKPQDMKSAQAIRDAVFTLARSDAKNKGKPDPITATPYRDLPTYQVGEATLSSVGPWLTITNKPGLAKAIADKFLDGGNALASAQDFVAAKRLAGDEGARPSVWAFLRTGPLRLLPGLGQLFDASKKSDNPGVEFILGGLLPTIQQTPYLTASGWISPQGIKLSVRTPTDAAWVPAARKFYFAAPGDGAAKALAPKDLILSVTTYRNLSALWQAGPDLFTEDVAAKMAQSDSGLSTVFGGKSFSAEVLGSINPQLQFIVARQDYKGAGVHEPGIRIPGAALILSVKSDQFASLRKRFRIGFQSAIAFGNIDAGQKGRSMLEIQTETRSGAEIQYATYDPADEDTSKKPMANPATGAKADATKADATKAGASKADAKGDSGKGEMAKTGTENIYLNFSPALVMSNKYMMLCSTKQLAEELADLAAQPSTTLPDNTRIHVVAAPVAQLIHDNREQLVAKNILEKGHSRATAEKEIDLLQSLVSIFQEGTVRLVPTDKTMSLDIELTIAPKK